MFIIAVKKTFASPSRLFSHIEYAMSNTIPLKNLNRNRNFSRKNTIFAQKIHFDSCLLLFSIFKNTDVNAYRNNMQLMHERCEFAYKFWRMRRSKDIDKFPRAIFFAIISWLLIYSYSTVRSNKMWEKSASNASSIANKKK